MRPRMKVNSGFKSFLYNNIFINLILIPGKQYRIKIIFSNLSIDGKRPKL